jgi:L-aminopeptidase/D-esterase-like protein
MLNAITDIDGIRVGHASDYDGLTGCTVVLFDAPACCGVDVRGSAAGTSQIDALAVDHIVDEAHAIVLAGGSAFGLEAVTGVMRYLQERQIGYDAAVAKVPIVPAAAILDLGFGDNRARPTAQMGYDACAAAGRLVQEGSVGATVGKLFAMPRAMKGGLGTASVVLPDGALVAALVVVNAFGDVIDNVTGRIIAGLRTAEGELALANTVSCLREGQVRPGFGGAIGNTTLAVVATNVQFNKREITKVARMAQGGLVKTITPVHTTLDGDLVFSVSLGSMKGDVNRVGVVGEFVVAEAIKRAVRKADGFGRLPAFKDIPRGSKAYPDRPPPD